jgi:acyl-coenzyme A synthetase/AMP-(fatty) acid ligase
MLHQPTEKKYPPDYLSSLGYKATEVSWISHTTGTTGFPKFVEIPTSARMTLCKGFVQAWKLTADDIIGAFSPATGGPNIIVYWGASLVGAKVVMMERFEAEAALKLIEKERITALGLVPTMFIITPGAGQGSGRGNGWQGDPVLWRCRLGWHYSFTSGSLPG